MLTDSCYTHSGMEAITKGVAKLGAAVGLGTGDDDTRTQVRGPQARGRGGRGRERRQGVRAGATRGFPRPAPAVATQPSKQSSLQGRTGWRRKGASGRFGHHIQRSPLHSLLVRVPHVLRTVPWSLAADPPKPPLPHPFLPPPSPLLSDRHRRQPARLHGTPL